MIFVYKKWERFCKSLFNKGMLSLPAKSVTKDNKSFLVLKHDVETNVKKAFKLAKIEKKYNHCGSYYVQAYLLNNPKNVKILQNIQRMGHEVSYHYDVMDFAKGDIEKADAEFNKNLSLFEKEGFEIATVCQHGNPLIERIGYTSNRDFFRNPDIQSKYSNISDIMVNYKTSRQIDYLYYSDAGRVFKLVFDPLFNDVVNSDDKNISYRDLKELEESLNNQGRYIISTHPHRWCASSLAYSFKALFFKIVKFFAKLLYKIPFMRRFINKHYYLAKKI